MHCIPSVDASQVDLITTQRRDVLEPRLRNFLLAISGVRPFNAAFLSGRYKMTPHG